MLVTNVEISQYTYCERTERHTANVCMTLGDMFVTLFCALDIPANECPKTRAKAFVGDAMRQLRRMPEYRSGHKSIELSEQVDAPLPMLA
ncbi:hypothetical protein TRL7639_03284 [Falsiruegeria litorea R37]|uniref:Uncharacterized protein n=1 Tax=Falsiruegeria litorea R37 TaxID=1200284 RepID=A0A1Y5TAU7_9RHOB|nr:hypothetical protein [Falsiruegeria litorea]SLN59759.1 hypothetical protein TRL7639_03284 [Falsiruegeria litorea R37]